MFENDGAMVEHPNKQSPTDRLLLGALGFSRGSPSYYRELNHIYAWTVKGYIFEEDACLRRCEHLLPDPARGLALSRTSFYTEQKQKMQRRSAGT